ncbi:coiled-coil domain-containing protein [Bradyrhizobium symbiodeficiens]|uniref:coiled-coil domain-containing protein n=1 Tax=Bradyrhizobium symbiodeficiens TaxID=1404367 RepID=UPI000BA1B0C4|nr:hypothetical protein [Bradyrhizobium symbiodeficiens]AWM06102.1 hypothetical protein CIT39_06305 [Bradyrhizobium symbiodeficiens]
MVIGPAHAAGEPTPHYELAFVDKDRRRFVALFEIPPQAKDDTLRKDELRGPPSAAAVEKLLKANESLDKIDEALPKDTPKYLMLWDRREFGPNAGFKIERKSKAHYPDGTPPEKCHDACEAQKEPPPLAKTTVWLPVEWILTVSRASFPGNESREFTATFTFKRTDVMSEWTVSASLDSWWSSQKKIGPLSTVALTNFLRGQVLAFEIKPNPNALLEALFGQRIESAGALALQVDHQLAWAIDTEIPKRPAGRLYILDIPLEFGRLSLKRLRGEKLPEDSSAARRGSNQKDDGKSASPRYLFEDQVAYGRPTSKDEGSPDGLYGVAEKIVGFTQPKSHEDSLAGVRHPAKANPKTGTRSKSQNLQTSDRKPLWVFDFAKTKVEGTEIAAELELDGPAIDFAASQDSSKVHVVAAIRHWGVPQHSVAGCMAEPKNEARSIGRIRLRQGECPSATWEGPFEFCGFEMMRQQQHEFVVTRFRAWPASKESIASLRLGDIGLAALPAISASPGAAPRVPTIDLDARDRVPAREDDRQLVGFVARLSLYSAAIALPERIVPKGEKEAGKIVVGQHVTHLQFHDADTLVYLPAFGRPPVTSADAYIPIGPTVGGVKATFDLGRARLSVIRPKDLLALKYRFSGLELVVAWPPVAGEAAELAPRGGRSTSRPFAQAARSEATPRDERPMLVVEFPPQHVVEQAYFRQLKAPLDLPELARPADADEENVKLLRQMLRQPKDWVSANETTERWRIWVNDLLDGVYRPDKQNPGTKRDKRVEWRKALQLATGWPNSNPLFPKDPGLDGPNGQTMQDFDYHFINLARVSGLPLEQQLYIGPDFLDPDARRIALEVLRALKEKQAPAQPRLWPFAPLPPTDWDDVFAPLVKAGVLKDKKEIPPQTNSAEKQSALSEKKPIWPEFDKDRLKNPLYLETFRQIELARERRSRDYATLRSLYALKVQERKEVLKGLADYPEYFGPMWFDGLIKELETRDDNKGYAAKNALADLKQKMAKAIELSDQEEFESFVPSRLSGPSRIAFRVDCDDYEPDRAGGRIPYTLEGLTNWGGMDMAVVRRAERLMEPVQGTRLPPRWGRRALNDEAANLQFQGFTSSQQWGKEKKEKDEKENYRRKPATTAVTAEQRLAEVYAASSRPPDAFETAIELPFRLFLSPAQDASWITSSPRVRRDAGFSSDLSIFRELWTARLGGRDDTAGVRAIWSPDYRPEALLSTNSQGAPPIGHYAPWALPRGYGVRKLPDRDIDKFRTGLEPFDRHELVVLSSVHGLPVLGRRAPSEDLAPDADQIEPPEGFRLQGLLPETIGGKLKDMTAIYRPKPLSVNELSLSALGGNLDVDAAFQPPASARRQSDARNLFDALSVERWRQRTVLGRDVLVEVVYKGFLFPIGHRASLVKLTERRFEAVPGRDSPVAILVQRLFLKIGKPEKRFMAEGQPNRGSRWPCERILMLTRQTPDLVDARSEDRTPPNEMRVFPRGKIDLGDGTTGLCMWPRTSARRGAEVWFEMQIGDEPTPVRMPLIFVDNIAANDETTVGKLIEYYQKEASFKMDEASPTRRLVRNGQPVVMAPEYKPGDTTFDTEWWLVGAEGREKEYPKRDPGSQTLALNNRNYIRTSFMEGQDQPPFYPLIEMAKCRLKSVERFTGSGPLWAQVAFDGEYVASGFAEARDSAGKQQPRSDQSEIYLRIVKSDDGDGTLPLDFKDRGDLAGGVAHPTMDVVAISRQLGPINGGAAPTLSRPLTAADAPNPPDAPAAPTAGILPLLERINRFKDSINIVPKGRFLGIMDLSDLVQKVLGIDLHPKLNELIEYAAASAGDAAAGTLTEVRSALTKVLIVPAEKAVAAVDKAWLDLANKQLSAQGVKAPTLAEVYPQIGTDIAGLHRLLLDVQKPGTDDISFFAELAAVHEAARRLGRSIDNIARDPLAAAATAQLDIYRELSRPIDEIRRKIDDLRALDFVTALDALIEPEAKKLVLAKLREMARINPAQINLNDGFKQLDEVVRKALDAAWPPKLNSIEGLVAVPREIAKKLREEVEPLPNGDIIKKVPATQLADALDKLVDELKPAVNAAVQLQQELTRKLITADAKYRATIAVLQKDADDAKRRAQQAVLEILLIPQVAKAIILAIEIKAAVGATEFKPPFDQEKLTKLLLAMAPALNALATLGGADRVAAKLFFTANTLCGQVKAALKAAVAAVLPLPTTLLNTAQPVKDISDAIEAVKAASDALSDQDKSDFSSAAAGLLAKIRDFGTAITELTTTITGWTADATCTAPLPTLGAQSANVAQKQRSLITALQRLTDVTVDLVDKQLRKDIDQGKEILKTVTAEIELLKKVFDNAGKLSLVATASSAFESFAASLQPVSSAIRTALPSVANSLDRLARDQRERLDLQMQIDDLRNARERLEALHSVLKNQATTSQDAVEALKAGIAATQKEFLIQQELVVRRVSQALAAELYDLVTPPAALALQWATDLVARFGDKPLAALSDALDVVMKRRKDLDDLIEKGGDVIKGILDTLAKDIGAVPGDATGPSRAYLFLVDPTADRSSDALRKEQLLAQAAKDNWSSDQALALVRLTELADAWRKPALVVLVQRFNALSTAFLRAVLVEALDLRALRRELERIVRELIPSKAILGYALSTPVRQFGLPGIGDVFLPVKGTQLDIRMQAVIDLQNPKAPDARVDGRMGPFAIQLFGNFDVVKLNFHGLEFRSGGGRKSGFDVRFGDFEIGSKAKFLKQLEPYVSPKSGLPPVRMMRDKPGIEATYGINLGSFGVGYLSFSNVSLNAGARLPFGAGEEAEFLISIGRADAPFLISSTVFGGGGYLALLANGKGFIGLETSFDYGGVFAFGFGPLTGAGQITLGLYFRAARGSPARLGMNFMARGAANIACFSVCAALFVRLTYVGGKMDGRASYTFSFSIGIDDIDFTFDVYVNQGGNAGAAAPTTFLDLPGMPALTQFAGARPELLDAYAYDETAVKPSGCKLKGPELSVKTKSPKADWNSYHALFDTIDPIVKV